MQELRAAEVEPRQRRLDRLNALGWLFLAVRPSDQDTRPLAVVAEPVAVAQADRFLRAVEHAGAVAPHLMQHGGIGESGRLAETWPSRRASAIAFSACARAAGSSPSSQRVCE